VQRWNLLPEFYPWINFILDSI